MRKFYKKTATGAIQEWSIGGKLSSRVSSILIKYGQAGGAMQTQLEEVTVNHSGRSIREQMLSRINSRIDKQLAKGYRRTVEDAIKFENKNELNLSKPMLAQPYGKVKDVDFVDCYRQRKLDGHRLLVTCLNGVNIAYTRNGKPVDTLDHIIDHMVIPEGVTIDGEVYHHGTPLQTVSSWCKRLQEDTLKLKYHVYDIVAPSSFALRYGRLAEFDLGPNVQLVETWLSNDTIHDDLNRVVEEGYEGLMLRQSSYPYGTGKRCKSLIKVKKLLDGEFRVVAIHESADGWAILECQIGEQTFRTSAPGTMVQKRECLQNKESYIGKLVTCEYFSLTKDGLPFHCSARRWREDL